MGKRFSSRLCRNLTIAVILGCLMLVGCSEEQDFDDIREGDIVTFGRYEQDNFIWNGKEPITWEVLEVEEDRAVLISKYCLTLKPIHEERAKVTWKDCDLREWLNDDFIELAFSEEERELLLKTEFRDGESNTKDRVFLLSLEELEYYYGAGYQDEKESRAPMTKYVAARYPWDAIAHNFKDRPKEGDTIKWWLRTPGSDPECFEVVDGSAKQFSQGQTVSDREQTGVRPVIVIDLDNID